MMQALGYLLLLGIAIGAPTWTVRRWRRDEAEYQQYLERQNWWRKE